MEDPAQLIGKMIPVSNRRRDTEVLATFTAADCNLNKYRVEDLHKAIERQVDEASKQGEQPKMHNRQEVRGKGPTKVLSRA